MISTLTRCFLGEVVMDPSKIYSKIAAYDLSDKSKLLMELEQISNCIMVDICESAELAEKTLLKIKEAKKMVNEAKVFQLKNKSN